MDKAIALIKRWEGFSPVPYVCPAGYWTIGYGTLCTKNHPPIDEATAEKYLVAEVVKVLPGILRMSGNLTGNKLEAVVSWVYNLGLGRYQASTMRKRINEGNWDAAAIEMQRWVYGGGKKLAGLVARRREEAALLIS